jgi:hypothetical protein
MPSQFSSSLANWDGRYSQSQQQPLSPHPRSLTPPSSHIPPSQPQLSTSHMSGGHEHEQEDSARPTHRRAPHFFEMAPPISTSVTAVRQQPQCQPSTQESASGNAASTPELELLYPSSSTDDDDRVQSMLLAVSKSSSPVQVCPTHFSRVCFVLIVCAAHALGVEYDR